MARILLLITLILVLSACGTTNQLAQKMVQNVQDDTVRVELRYDGYSVLYQGKTYELEYDENGGYEKSYKEWLKSLKVKK